MTDQAITFREACHKHRLTRRQVDYLIQKGGLKPTGGGHGRERTFDPCEQRVLDVLTRLVAAGWAIDKARPIAREVAELGLENVRLPGNVTVTIPPSQQEVDTHED